jgi:hypothetical protein
MYWNALDSQNESSFGSIQFMNLRRGFISPPRGTAEYRRIINDSENYLVRIKSAFPPIEASEASRSYPVPFLGARQD